MDNIESWQGAAIASTSRLLLPVHCVEYQKESKLHSKDFHYSDAHNLLTRLEKMVLAEVADRSEALT